MWKNDALAPLGLPAEAKEVSEKPAMNVAVGPQLSILLRIANGMSHPAFEGQTSSSLLGTSEGVVDVAHASGPGSELGAAIVAARLNDVPAAMGLIDELESKIQDGSVTASEDDIQLMNDVRQGLEALAAPGPEVLSADAQVRLTDRLRSAGRTLSAMATDDTAQLESLAEQGIASLVGLIVVGLGAILLGLLGLVSLVVFLVKAITGTLEGPGPSSGERSHLYAEMFAAWMAVFLVLHLVSAQLIGESPETSAAPSVSTEWQLILSMLMTVAAFVGALAWGFFRGLKWSTIRQDVALTPARISDVWWGLVGYSMGVACLAGGVLVMLFLVAVMKALGVSDEQLQPSHPVQEWLETGGPGTLLLTFLLAAVMAPLFEEFLFRGVLYRHLRDSFGAVGPVVAVAGAVVASSVLFAAIHPQGIVFIPILGGLAVSFCLMREWRGSINPSIWTHAINNGLIVSLNLLLLR
jgi:membrane protease YdiL (CAAX protease family)